jgi:glutaredoxin 3
MAKVEIYTKSWCGFSVRAKDHLDRKGVSYEEIDVTTDAVREMEMVNRSHRHTVPQIFIDGHHLGGSDDLLAGEASGLLDRLLAGHSEGEAA